MSCHDAAEIKARIGSRKVIASISGGKDSAALALYLMELGIPFESVFMDTGWEHPDLYVYLRGELSRVIGPIRELRADVDMVGLLRKKQMFPSRRIRFCSLELKLQPFVTYLKSLDDEPLVALGIRAEESRERSLAPEWEWSDAHDCEVWRPLISWTEQDVIDIHHRHDLLPNPLYLRGAPRVGCWPCINATLAQIAMLDEERILLIEGLESELTKAAQSRAAQRGETAEPRTWFHSHKDGAPVPIREAWEYARRGGDQGELFAALKSEPGCMRWGLCDIGGRHG